MTREFAFSLGARSPRARAFRSAAGLFAPLLLAAACDSASPPALEVAGVPISDGALANLQDPERQALLDLVAFGAAVAREETDALGEPIIARAIGNRRIAGLPYHVAAMEAGFDEATLRSAYEARPEWELDVRHVVRLVESGMSAAARDSALGVAREVAARAAAGEDFAALAAAFSEEPGAAQRGGLLQPGRQGSWVDAFWDAASALQPGQVSGVVESEYGYHVLRLDDRRPVPYAEASRTALLERTLPSSAASEAMERWAARNATVLIDPPALAEARRRLLAGESVSDLSAIAGGAGGREYDGHDLAVGWAALAPDDRVPLERGDEMEFARWLEADARRVIWAEVAEEIGVEPPSDAEAGARLAWARRVVTWSRAFALAPGMSVEQVRDAALGATLSGSAEARAARVELRSLRPLLRERYPVVVFDP